MPLEESLQSLLGILPNILSFASLAGCITIGITGYVIYQAFLHPLAQYPGPFIAKLTSLYSVYQAFKGDRHSDLYELHLKYGPVVRIGPYHISINNTQALGSIYGHNANVQKSSLYASFYGNSILTARDKKAHGRKKRVMSNAFSDQALRSMEPYILSAIRDWCSALGDGDGTNSQTALKVGEWSTPKDMAHWSACVIFDTLGEICFGKTFETSLRDENHFFFALMSYNMYIINIVGQMPILKPLGVEAYLRRGTTANRQRQVAFSRKQLSTRLAATPDTTNRKDIIYYLLQARDPETGEGYSDPELISEVTTLLGAGSDTASTALASTFYFLTQHPAILERLVDDIRSTFPDLESVVSGPLMQKMTYLRACFDESMRLAPPLPTLLPREVLSGGLHTENYFFPAGTIIGVPIYALQHNEEYFDQPFTYNPSRWLLRGSPGTREGEGVTADSLEQQKKAFVPFSTGPRVCIGRNLALMELEIILARVLWLYNIRVERGKEYLGVGREGEYKIRDHFAAGKDGPVLQFQRRI